MEGVRLGVAPLRGLETARLQVREDQRHAGAVSPRGARRRRAAAPQHHHGLRPRRSRRSAVHRDGADRGQRPERADRGPRPAGARAQARHRDRGAPGSRLRARPRGHPPRHQTRQRAHRQRRARQDHGLRHRAPAVGGGHRLRRDRRHADLHGAGADHQRPDLRGHRRVRRRLHALRAARVSEAVRGRVHPWGPLSGPHHRSQAAAHRRPLDSSFARAGRVQGHGQGARGPLRQRPRDAHHARRHPGGALGRGRDDHPAPRGPLDAAARGDPAARPAHVAARAAADPRRARRRGERPGVLLPLLQPRHGRRGAIGASHGRRARAGDPEPRAVIDAGLGVRRSYARRSRGRDEEQRGVVADGGNDAAGGGAGGEQWLALAGDLGLCRRLGPVPSVAARSRFAARRRDPPV